MSDHTIFEGCPCTLVTACCDSCSCAHPALSGGCMRCAKYGSLGQRTVHAQRIADILDAAVVPPTLEGSAAITDEQGRAWALANVRRESRGDQRTCIHRQQMTSMSDAISAGCVECAFELGRREGQAEAGAVMTSAEVFA